MKRLIVIEGLDGAGKATQATLLSERLQREGISARQISFPNYDSPSSALVKMYLAGEFGSKPDDVNAYAASSFYALDRFATLKKELLYNEPELIIADRYTTSNAIHQCCKLNREQWDDYLDWLFSYEYDLLGIIKPTLVLYLKVETSISQSLLKQRYHGADNRDIHEMDIEYLNKCENAADYCSQKLGWITIDCCQNNKIRAIEEIHVEIMNIVKDIM